MTAIIDADRLRENLRGEVLVPEDTGYDEARAIYNAMIDKRPGLIARCVDAADVIEAVNFGREHGLDLAIRCGGHNGAGLALCDGGLVIDLSRMRGVRIDPDKRTAHVAAGAQLGDLDHAAHAFGLATPAGIMSTTGVGGPASAASPSAADTATSPASTGSRSTTCWTRTSCSPTARS
jgi:FAD/FMN-containing dehydrogenase